jgi:hypothetical protein
VYLLEMEFGKQNKGCKLTEPTHTKLMWPRIVYNVPLLGFKVWTKKVLCVCVSQHQKPPFDFLLSFNGVVVDLWRSEGNWVGSWGCNFLGYAWLWFCFSCVWMLLAPKDGAKLHRSRIGGDNLWKLSTLVALCFCFLF